MQTDSGELFNKLKQLRILLVEDDELIRDSLSLYFSCEGISICALETAEEGMAALQKQQYDIIITDYRLPGIDGLRFIKKMPETITKALIILITAYGTAEVRQEAQQLGVHDVIEKPLTAPDIEDALLRLLGAAEVAPDRVREPHHLNERSTLS